MAPDARRKIEQIRKNKQVNKPVKDLRQIIAKKKPPVKRKDPVPTQRKAPPRPNVVVPKPKLPPRLNTRMHGFRGQEQPVRGVQQNRTKETHVNTRPVRETRETREDREDGEEKNMKFAEAIKILKVMSKLYRQT